MPTKPKSIVEQVLMTFGVKSRQREHLIATCQGQTFRRNMFFDIFGRVNFESANFDGFKVIAAFPVKKMTESTII
jgi:hypothetical protein